MTETVMTDIDYSTYRFEDVVLSEHSTMKVGGHATAAFPENTEQLIDLINSLKQSCTEYEIVGQGSNIIFSDRGFDGVIIFTEKMNRISLAGSTMTCGCGALLSDVVDKTVEASLSGAEFLTGIPGSCGGGVYMNCGAFGHSISEITESAVCYSPDRGIVRLNNHSLKFAFRKSVLASSDLVMLEATFTLVPSDKKEVKQRVDTFNSLRKRQPLDYPSAGSVFLPSDDTPAWELVDGAGMRGATVGGAMVSKKHAGFIINTGNATADDVKTLTENIIREVDKKFGVTLKTEILFRGEW